MSKRIHIFLMIFWAGCYTIHNQHMLVRVGKNRVEKLDTNEYSIVYNEKRMRFENVVSVVWLNDEPYFELSDGKIIQWGKIIAKDAFNLQKILDRIYFIKQYTVDVEPCSASLNIIDSGGYKELVIKKNGKPEIFEDYFVLYPDEIYVVPWGEYFALIDSVGNVIKTYDLNK